MVEIFVNNNFHSSTKTSVFDGKNDDAFREYRYRWDTYPKNFIVGDFPIHLDIETTSACNLQCPFCASAYNNWGPSKKGFLEMETFRKIIDEGADNGLFSMKLSFRGEPLLHPLIAEMVQYAKDKGIIDVFFNTNGLLLTEKNCTLLINAGLDRLSISCEGFDAETYSRYRKGGNFSVLLQNVKNLRRIRSELQVDHPKIRIQTLLLPELTGNYPQYVSFWQEYADEVAYLDARSESCEADHRGQTADWACPFLWQRMVILWDGTVLPCLMHGIKDFTGMILGDVNISRISDMWLSDREKEIRSLHVNGLSHTIPCCDRCSYRALEINKNRV